MALKLFNTLTKKNEVFLPIKKGVATVYSCGPTVYDVPHIGNMRSYIIADLLRRTLKANGIKPNYVINITDVGHLTSDADSGDDKVEKKAKELNINAKDLTKRMTGIFFKYLKALNIPKSKFKFRKASDYIKEQVQVIQQLDKMGYTYQTSDGVYFNTKKFSDYGVLGQVDLENLEFGKRVDVGEKQNSTDFALWKFGDKNRQQNWSSPYGVGFPGWHLECSTIANTILGKTIDIHTGGIDHIPIHHNNEIAQAESVNGVKFSNFWLHIDHITIDGEKISKSVGNTISIDDLIKKGYSPLALKYHFYTIHYSTNSNFTFDSLSASQKKLNDLYRIYKNSPAFSVSTDREFVKNFMNFINDNLDAPGAIAYLLQNIKNIKPHKIRKTLKAVDEILGLEISSSHKTEIPKIVLNLLKEREVARNNKDYEKSDELRGRIESMGFKVLDSAGGATVERVY